MPVDIDLKLAAPMVSLAAGALAVLLLDLILPARRARPWAFLATLGSIGLAGWYGVGLYGGAAARSDLIGPVSAFLGAMWGDRMGLALNLVVLAAALLAACLSFGRREEDVSGYLALLLWATMGMMVLGAAGDLMVFFVALELLSLSLYVLVGFASDRRAREAAFKYFILGSAASALFLLGAAFLFGAVGSLAFAGIAAGARTGLTSPLFLAGGALVIAGIAFKLALAPFHVWTPDVYQGASTAVTAFMSVGTKAAAFAGLVRLLGSLAPESGAAPASLLAPLWVMALLSMVVGSLAALGQKNLKRMLAYSGVAHAGYLLVAFPNLTSQGVGAAFFYLGAYTATNLGAFAVIAWLEAEGRAGDELEGYTGLFYQKPWLSGLMTLYMVSLAGVAPTAGFMGKLLVIQAGMQAGAGGWAWALITGMVATTVVSAFVYLKVVRQMVAQPAVAGQAEVAQVAAASDSPGPGASRWVLAGIAAVLVLTAWGTLQLGLWPQSLLPVTVGLLPAP
ncbi:NADH-quinone oxidoreductase subunit N [Limnochorda pilosa]|uniref:NADH-quinone oxidoreductase subunit N n=1 Tax=Limnochorda pilosa TaxID=1555112 RepID=A0A0K2SP87_LIMPI|nr:NADH-quinone oxidoreductase subunit N [Limnochorda pilosa]BAS28935.1 NADH-quinone oxidoreductase subunit N [Limnochorda pilosa]